MKVSIQAYHTSRRMDTFDCMPMKHTPKKGTVSEVRAVLATSLFKSPFSRTLINCPDCGGQFLKTNRKLVLLKTSLNKKGPDVSKGLVITIP